jgi:threonine synthase
MKLICSGCRSELTASPQTWRCSDCGNPLEVERLPFRPDAIIKDDHSLWRYRAMLAVAEDVPIVTMGEGMTPLIEASFAGQNIHFKLEYVSPTGSFKDRGTTVLVTKLREWGVRRVGDDSSGNAGASLAAYCARAGINAEIFVPAHTSIQKKRQISTFGAKLRQIEGPREKAAEAVEKAVATTALVYASHAWSPYTYEGTKTVGYELWEQFRGRAPDCFVSPVGQGSLFLGAYRGFKDILAAGLISQLPRMIGVQSDACAPIADAYKDGVDRCAVITKRLPPSIAEGIALQAPIHDREILNAVRTTRGEVIAVSDDEIRSAQRELAEAGFYVEPTSAVVAAALRKARLNGVIVATLTGSGLKAPPNDLT